jgi:hypothetical protein
MQAALTLLRNASYSEVTLDLDPDTSALLPRGRLQSERAKRHRVDPLV